MNRAIVFLVVSVLSLVASVAVRIVWPVHRPDADPAIRALEDRHRSLAGYAAAVAETEATAARVHAALWTRPAVDAFMADLPKGWIARPIGNETRHGIALRRYAFSKEAAVREFPEVQRVLRKLEERGSTRIDTVNLTVNGDGRRFSTVLITATLPVTSTPQHP